MNKKHTAQSAFFNLRILITVLLCAVAACSLVTRPLLAFFRPAASTNDSQRTLTFAERVAYQRAIEEVYWRHRIWPKENLNPKPSLDAVMSQAQLENKVAGYLRESQALEDNWQKSITADQLQAEMDRIASDTKQPEVLRELFEALGNDPFVIAECLARPTLVKRDFAIAESRTASLEDSRAKVQGKSCYVANTNYRLPTISDASTECPLDTWTDTSTINAPAPREQHTAVWTGSEMIVWGGSNSNFLNTGGRYNPSTDSWTTTSTANAPDVRSQHTAVWTGSEMIVWGGYLFPDRLNTGGRYNPGTDTWTATSTTNAPSARSFHTAVWIGSEMIVWGGLSNDFGYVNTGGRYNSSTDTWTATTNTTAPAARVSHTAVWTGTEMIVWGGFNGHDSLKTGGRYNPSSNSWIATATVNAPVQRDLHTAVWIGSEMVVWGGEHYGFSYLNTGGRYTPSTDTWTATSTTNAPAARLLQTAVWTGSEMIVWGGNENGTYMNTGGR
jgi:N-acetylneuraminic acid mutarotase